MCDKGKGADTHSGVLFVKLLVRFDKARDKVMVVNVGIEGAANTIIRAAKAVDSILKVYPTHREKLLNSNHGTDASGGRIRIDLLEKLIEMGRLNSERQSAYHHSTCSLRG